jgi:hypothetical protein
MASQSLLNAQVEQGKTTLSALDAAGLDVRTAFWIFDEESQTWRFTVAEPTVDTRGTHALYELMARGLAGQSDALPLREIYVVSSDDQLVSLVRMAIATPGNAISGITFSGNVVMGNRIPDMFIYRMYRPPIARAAP